MKIVGAIFEKMKLLIFFLKGTILNFEGRYKKTGKRNFVRGFQMSNCNKIRQLV